MVDIANIKQDGMQNSDDSSTRTLEDQIYSLEKDVKYIKTALDGIVDQLGKIESAIANITPDISGKAIRGTTETATDSKTPLFQFSSKPFKPVDSSDTSGILSSNGISRSKCIKPLKATTGSTKQISSINSSSSNKLFSFGSISSSSNTPALVSSSGQTKSPKSSISSSFGFLSADNNQSINSNRVGSGNLNTDCKSQSTNTPLTGKLSSVNGSLTINDLPPSNNLSPSTKADVKTAFQDSVASKQETEITPDNEPNPDDLIDPADFGISLNLFNTFMPKSTYTTEKYPEMMESIRVLFSDCMSSHLLDPIQNPLPLMTWCMTDFSDDKNVIFVILYFIKMYVEHNSLDLNSKGVDMVVAELSRERSSLKYDSVRYKSYCPQFSIFDYIMDAGPRCWKRAVIAFLMTEPQLSQKNEAYCSKISPNFMNPKNEFIHHIRDFEAFRTTSNSSANSPVLMGKFYDSIHEDVQGFVKQPKCNPGCDTIYDCYAELRKAEKFYRLCYPQYYQVLFL